MQTFNNVLMRYKAVSGRLPQRFIQQNKLSDYSPASIVQFCFNLFLQSPIKATLSDNISRGRQFQLQKLTLMCKMYNYKLALICTTWSTSALCPEKWNRFVIRCNFVKSQHIFTIFSVLESAWNFQQSTGNTFQSGSIFSGHGVYIYGPIMAGCDSVQHIVCSQLTAHSRRKYIGKQ